MASTVGDFSVLSQVHLQISYCTISLKPSDIFAQIMECLISRPEWLIDTNFNLIHQCEVSKLMYLSFISLPVTWFVTVRYTLEYFRNRWRFLAENWVNWAPNSTYYFMKFWLENIRCSLRNRAITISKRTWKDWNTDMFRSQHPVAVLTPKPYIQPVSAISKDLE